MLNIGVTALCIFVVVALAYKKNNISYIANNTITLPQQESSLVTSDFENIQDDLPKSIDNIHAFVTVIRQQSKEQLRIWQIKNSEQDFKPERIIPMYFKSFYGDPTAMQR